jgi:hypothetical protein
LPPELSYPADSLEHEIEIMIEARDGGRRMTAPPDASFGSVDEAMDTARAALGYLARADAASLPAVTQAWLQREYERAQSQHTAGRARVLTAFSARPAAQAMVRWPALLV